MFNWFPKNEKGQPARRDNPEISKLEQKMERLEQTIQQLMKETRKQNIVVRELQIHHPVVENVTFRLDTLDIEELSGSLNLGNNFDVQFDPANLFGAAKSGKNKGEPPAAKAQTGQSAEKRRESAGEAFSRTSSGYSYRFGERS
jgi:predicted ribosome quality control (RQC) complex YloA/Tae2 family protein